MFPVTSLHLARKPVLIFRAGGVPIAPRTKTLLHTDAIGRVRTNRLVYYN
ncbi:hypothetical protein V1282_005670 [Nitrobacteraceae bacterium AZCC 2146]